MTVRVRTAGTVHGVRAEPGPAPRRFPWLLLVAAAWLLVQLVLVLPRLNLGWDESVYVSQVDPRIPAAYFSAPRSRGIGLLTAPVLAVTGSVPVLRAWLALLSAAALYGAFDLWRPLIGPVRRALAAALFAGLWTTQLYGSQAMPNLWVGLCAVAATACLQRSPGGKRRALAGVFLAVAVATLMRLSDGVWLALPLLAACVRHRPLRRPPLLAAVVGGLAAGALQWVVEAYVRWGGVLRRLDVSSATEGGMRLRWAGGALWRSLDGPLLCRPCTVPPPALAPTLWWLALPPLLIAACLTAPAYRRTATWLPTLCAVSLSVPYLFTLPYAAPRFLLPAYALAALPVAGLLTDIAARARLRPRRGRSYLTLTVLCLLLGAHMGEQFAVFAHNLRGSERTTRRYLLAAAQLRKGGLREPCLVTGTQAPPIGYAARCASANLGGNNRSITLAALKERARRESVAVLVTRGSPAPAYARHWRPLVLTGTGLTAFVAPRTTP
ncbi:hypothetical protein [Streptomyces sp. NPDC005004]